MRSLSAKSVALVFVPVLFAAILLPVGVVLQHPGRFDGSLWLATLGLIVVIMAIGVPLTIWQRKIEGRRVRVPWPVREGTRDAAIERHRPRVMDLGGSFTWTAEEFGRMRKAWLRYTPAGRTHRRMIYGLSGIAFGGVAAACVWLWQGQLMAMGLLFASVALVALVYSDRIREFEEVRSRTRVSWKLVSEGMVFETGGALKEIPWSSIYAILRTRAGFLIWPGDLRETWLPVSAFDNGNDVEAFAEIAGSQVGNYVHENQRDR